MKTLDISVDLAGIRLQNPVTTASGTFSVRDSGRWYDPGLLGAVITKGVSQQPWEGNPTPRIAESHGGMLNAVGLMNPGVERFLREDMPLLSELGTRVIVNVVGKSVSEYCSVAERLSESAADMLELNISCPNIKAGGIGFGTDPKLAAEVTKEVKRVSTKPLIVKLSPNVTDVTEIARAVESAGADAVSLINTLLGMRIDARKSRPVLANLTGGLSGPAIKPVALRMVYQVRRAIALPIVGLGGIMTGEDAAEFLMAGADAVSVGTAALIDPEAPVRILNELTQFMSEEGFAGIREMRDAFCG